MNTAHNRMTRNKTALIYKVCNPVCISKLLSEHETMLLTASVQNSAAISMKVLIPYCASDSLVFSGTQPVLFVLLSSVHSSVIVTLAVARSK